MTYFLQSQPNLLLVTELAGMLAALRKADQTQAQVRNNVEDVEKLGPWTPHFSAFTRYLFWPGGLPERGSLGLRLAPDCCCCGGRQRPPGCSHIYPRIRFLSFHNTSLIYNINTFTWRT